MEKSFDKFLSGELLFTPIKEESLAAQIISVNKDRQCFDSIYSFNYIEYGFLKEIANGHVGRLENVQYVHGLGQNLIFGIDEEGCKSREYSFVKKVMHNNYPSTNIISDLMQATEAVFFGHSINEIDWKYFEMFFQKGCLYNNNHKRHITIITKDDDSKKQLKINLNKFGISITNLLSISQLEFIETDLYYKGSYEERDKFQRLLFRLENQYPRLNTD